MDTGDGGSRIGRRRLAVVSLSFAALLAACGSFDDPMPSSMCPASSATQVVAYEFDGGGVEWVSCTDETGYRSLLPVADGAKLRRRLRTAVRQSVPLCDRTVTND